MMRHVEIFMGFRETILYNKLELGLLQLVHSCLHYSEKDAESAVLKPLIDSWAGSQYMCIMSYHTEHVQLVRSLNPPAAMVRMEKSSYSICYPSHEVAFTELLID